jgi:CubicO group peptidase (beta-lactamase class C family)
MKRLSHFLAFLFVALPFALQCQTKQIKNLDTYLEKAMLDWGVPGMEVLIVKDGEVLLEKGYGVRNTETNEPVTENTLMAIASNTKAFTTASLSMLVDEGKINWTDKVIDYLPYFKMYDPYVTQEFTIEDLVTHRSGLATFSGDLLWYGTTHSRVEVIKRAQFLKPVRGFREGYGYQNIMFTAAGEVIAAVSGMSWEDFVKQRILTPIGMERTLTSTLEMKNGMDVSSPHNYKFEKQIPIEWINWDNMSAAGSIISSVSEMKEWLFTQLNSGIHNSDTLWSASRSAEMHSVKTAKGISNWSKKNFPSKTFSGYGLGWDIFNYHGQKVLNHGGGYDGFISKVALVPEENLGIGIPG